MIDAPNSEPGGGALAQSGAETFVTKLIFAGGRVHEIEPDREGRRRWSFSCPLDGHAHADANPSGALTEADDGRALVYCWTHGAAYAEIADAIGFRPSASSARSTNGAGPTRAPKRRPGLLDLPGMRELNDAADRLRDRSDVMNRLCVERAWAHETIADLWLGLDLDGRITIPYRSAVAGDARRPFTVERWAAPWDRPANVPNYPKTLAEPGRGRWPYLPLPGGPGAPALDPDEITLLVEGAPDAIAITSLGLQAAALPSARVEPEWVAYLVGNGARQVAVALDGDDAGRAASAKAVELLRAAGAEAWAVDLGDGIDATEFIIARTNDRVAARDDLVALVESSKTAPETAPDDRAGTISTGRSLRLTTASSVRPSEARFLDPERMIPLGALTMLVGDPGLGKSTLACRVAAHVSRGAGAYRGGSVLFVSAEDSIAATLVPRLMAERADLDRIAFVEAFSEGSPDGLRLPDDVRLLAERIEETGATYVIIDPLSAHLAADVNGHRDQDVRRALAPLAQVADEHGCAIEVVAHLNKNQGANALYRVGGSIGSVGAARSVRLLAQHPELENDDVALADAATLRVLTHIKCNVAPLAGSSTYRVEPAEIENGAATIATSRLTYVGTSELRASDLLDPPKPRRRTAQDDAADFLRAALGDGGVHDSAEIKAQAADARISTRTLQRALAHARVQVFDTPTTPRKTLWRVAPVAPSSSCATPAGPGWRDCEKPVGKGFSSRLFPVAPEGSP